MRKGLIDLHVHTVASGESIVTQASEVLRLCLVNGVQTLSITDHNSAEGSREALKFLRRHPEEFKDIEFIPGIELSCDTASVKSYIDKDGAIRATMSGGIHLLGYGIDPYDERYYELERLYSSELGMRTLGVYKMIKRHFGIKVNKKTIEKVISKRDTTPKNLLYRCLTMGDEPYFSDMNIFMSFCADVVDSDVKNYNAFCMRIKECLSCTGEKLMGYAKQDVYEMMELIESTGGVAVLAHPTLYRPKMELAMSDFELLKEMVVELTKTTNKDTGKSMRGLVGLEMLHGKSFDEQFKYKFFDGLIKEKGLYVTGGSDSHIKKHTYNNYLGNIRQNYAITSLDFLDDFDKIKSSPERVENHKNIQAQCVLKNDYQTIKADEIIKGRCISQKIIRFEQEVAGQLYYINSLCKSNKGIITNEPFSRLNYWGWLYAVYLKSILENNSVLFDDKVAYKSWLYERKQFFEDMQEVFDDFKANTNIYVRKIDKNSKTLKNNYERISYQNIEKALSTIRDLIDERYIALEQNDGEKRKFTQLNLEYEFN